MSIVEFIKNHNIYKHVKENNSLFIFLLTISGTAMTFVFRGFVYVYYYAKFRALQVPATLISDRFSSVKAIITVIEIVLAIISLLMGVFFVSAFKELKRKKESYARKEYIFNWISTLIVALMILGPLNFAFLILLKLDIGFAMLCLESIILTCTELWTIKVTWENAFGGNKKPSLLSIVFVIVILISASVAVVYISGKKSAIDSSNHQQIITIDKAEYVVLETIDYKYVLAECEENDNELIINTNKQKVINLENVEYENKIFDSIKLEGNK